MHGAAVGERDLVAVEALDPRLHGDVAVADPVVQLGGHRGVGVEQSVIGLGQPPVLGRPVVSRTIVS